MTRTLAAALLVALWICAGLSAEESPNLAAAAFAAALGVSVFGIRADVH